MILSFAAAVVFAVVALKMAMKEKGTLSHRMAWIPGVMASTELAMFGLLAVWEYPVLTLVLMACRITVLTCCSLAMKKDEAAARNRRRRREVFRRVSADSLQYEVQGNVIPLRRCA